MGALRNKGKTNVMKFGQACGKNSKTWKKQMKLAYEKGEFLDKVKYKNFKGPSYQIKSMKACVGSKPRINFIVRRIPINLKRLKFIKSIKRETAGRFNEVEDPLDGCRIMNLDLLKHHVTSISSHTALCDKARSVVLKGNSPIVLQSEERHGLASIIKAKCTGCGEVFKLNNSDCIETAGGKHYEINVRGVWGSMVTGGGCSSLNECLGELFDRKI